MNVGFVGRACSGARARGLAALAAAWLLATSSTNAAEPPPAAATAPSDPPPKRLALVVSGGVSEGSYQAGTTYALLSYYMHERDDYRRSHAKGANVDLQIATGASAGNINIVLASTYWLGEAGGQQVGGTPVGSDPTDNVFWDTWINVGMDRLVPQDNDWQTYAPLFNNPLAGPTFPKTIPPPPGRERVYTSHDGLVTREGLDAVILNARNNLLAVYPPGSEGHDLDLGITLTSEVTAPLALPDRRKPAHVDLCPDKAARSLRAQQARQQGLLSINVQRYVTPFHARISNFQLVMENVDAEWTTRHRLLGNVLPLVEPTKLGTPPRPINIDDLITTVKAAKSFPLAFGPLAVPTTCPNARHDVRYWDGGLYDNVPVTLAFELDKDRRAKDPANAPPLTLMYVDAANQRAPLAADFKPASGGLSLLKNLLINAEEEARKYELEAVARFDTQRLAHTDFTMPDRFFPIAAELLPASFGAFLHIDFRRHDYFVGFYDALFTIAEQRALGGTNQPRTVDEWTRVQAELLGQLDRLTCPEGSTGDACDEKANHQTQVLRAFVRKLLADELRARAPGSIAAQQDTKATSHFPKDRVWAIHQALWTDNEQKRRYLIEAGDAAKLVAFDKKAPGLAALLENINAREILGAKPPERGVDGLLVAEADALVRRAIDIERADQRNLLAAKPEGDDKKKVVADDIDDSRTFEDTLQLGRLALVSAVDRSREYLDLDPSTVTRLRAGGSWPSWFWHLFPYYFAKHTASCLAELGWEPKIRLGDFFFAGNAAIRMAPACDNAPVERKRFGAGIGWGGLHPILDDIQLLAVTAIPGGFKALNAPDMIGFELGVNVLTKLRVALGMYDLWSRPAPGTGLEVRWPAWSLAEANLSRFYLSLGWTDLNGTLYWLTRRWFASCEADCEDLATGQKR